MISALQYVSRITSYFSLAFYWNFWYSAMLQVGANLTLKPIP